MDCCRVPLKKMEVPVATEGESQIFYAEKPGDAAKSGRSNSEISAFTASFFKKWDEQGSAIFPQIMDFICPDSQITGSKRKVDLTEKI